MIGTRSRYLSVDTQSHVGGVLRTEIRADYELTSDDPETIAAVGTFLAGLAAAHESTVRAALAARDGPVLSEAGAAT